MLTVNSDAHDAAGLDVMAFGVAVARRAWARAEDVANTWPVEKLVEFIRQK